MVQPIVIYSLMVVEEGLELMECQEFPVLELHTVDA